jgi:hypothetical protein
MGGKNAAKFKQSISDIIESISDEIYTDRYSHSVSMKSHMTYLESNTAINDIIHQASILPFMN